VPRPAGVRYRRDLPESTARLVSNSFDLLFRGLELVTGGQRLHHYEDYLKALESRGLDPEPYARTSWPSGTACLRTADLRSGSSAG
jgi:hypothetical protein